MPNIAKAKAKRQNEEKNKLPEKCHRGRVSTLLRKRVFRFIYDAFEVTKKILFSNPPQ